jgi:hypothetical protein
MTDEPKVFTMLHQYDEAKRELRALEAELNKECALYGRNVLGLWNFSPNHLRQRLYALGLMKEQTNA